MGKTRIWSNNGKCSLKKRKYKPIRLQSLQALEARLHLHGPSHIWPLSFNVIELKKNFHWGVIIEAHEQIIRTFKIVCLREHQPPANSLNAKALSKQYVFTIHPLKQWLFFVKGLFGGSAGTQHTKLSDLKRGLCRGTEPTSGTVLLCSDLLLKVKENVQRRVCLGTS